MDDYDHQKFVNVGASEKFTLISNNRSFIKEKGFHHLEDFFRKTIAKKWWKALCQPPLGSCHNGYLRILRQLIFTRGETSMGEERVGRFQLVVYQRVL